MSGYEKETNRMLSSEVCDEDTIQCYYFVPTSDADEKSLNIWEANIYQFIKNLSSNYIWHRDEFKVHKPLNIEKSKVLPPHLISNTCFGDNIEDEWFIVHIILKLTETYTDLIVQLQDNDGDFLLIESADVLPSWAKPNTTENRVFVYKGHIHIIPPNIADIDSQLSINKALQYLVQYADQTQASTEIEMSILKRIGTYPTKLEDSIHRAVVELPIEIAAVLKLDPQLIAHMVNTYCHHDIIDERLCKNYNFKNTVLVKLPFTKCLYAMLLHSKLMKKFVCYQNDKKKSLGIKLACGFEIIMHNSSDIYSSKDYQKFMKNLKENGYFKNNIEGSQEYKKLLETSKDFFLNVESPHSSSICSNITKIMNNPEFFNIKNLLQNGIPSDHDLEDDSEDWLNIHPEQLNDLLNSRFGKLSKFQNNDIITPLNITSTFKDFLSKTSDFEGIETNRNEQLENKIEFDTDDFMNCIESMLKQISCNKSDADVDSDFNDGSLFDSDDDCDIDQEIKIKLQDRSETVANSKSIHQNIIQSLKEEHAAPGPSSNILTSMGMHKSILLDSDDE